MRCSTSKPPPKTRRTWKGPSSGPPPPSSTRWRAVSSVCRGTTRRSKSTTPPRRRKRNAPANADVQILFNEGINLSRISLDTDLTHTVVLLLLVLPTDRHQLVLVLGVQQHAHLLVAAVELGGVEREGEVAQVYLLLADGLRQFDGGHSQGLAVVFRCDAAVEVAQLEDVLGSAEHPLMTAVAEGLELKGVEKGERGDPVEVEGKTADDLALHVLELQGGVGVGSHVHEGLHAGRVDLLVLAGDPETGNSNQLVLLLPDLLAGLVLLQVFKCQEQRFLLKFERLVHVDKPVDQNLLHLLIHLRVLHFLPRLLRKGGYVCKDILMVIIDGIPNLLSLHLHFLLPHLLGLHGPSPAQVGQVSPKGAFPLAVREVIGDMHSLTVMNMI